MKKIFLLAAAAMTLAACNNGPDVNDVDEPVALQITASIDCSVSSRATDQSWDAGDAIGVSLGDNYKNLKYTTQTAAGDFTGPTTMYFKNKREAVTLTAYYPFSGDEGASPTLTVSTTADNQTADKQAKYDILYAECKDIIAADLDKADPPHTVKANLQFKHKMSKLTLILKSGLDVNINKITSYELSGLVLDGEFNTAIGTFTLKSDDTERTINMNLSAGDIKDAASTQSLLILPQQAAEKTVKLTLTDNGGQYYECYLNFADNEIKSGNNYRFTVTVNKTQLIVNTTIENWGLVEHDLVEAK